MVSKLLVNFDEPYEPSDLTAYERYEVLLPILTEASRTYMRFFSEPEEKQRDIEISQTLAGLFEQAASTSGKMSSAEVRRTFMSFNSNGLPGLLTPIPLNANSCAVSFNGTWEMRHRFTNGGRTEFAGTRHNTSARSHIYYDLLDPEDNVLQQLTVMWTEENHYPREVAIERFMADRAEEEQTFLLASLTKIKLSQVDPWTVEYTDEGEVIGNHGEFLNGVKYRSRAVMMRFGASECLIGVPDTRIVLPDGTEQPAVGMFLLVNVLGGGPAALSFPMSGLPPMADDGRTYDTVDTYIKINSDRPLIGGFEPIASYFSRLRDPEGFMSSIRAKADRAGSQPHGFHPQSRGTLHDYKRDY
ncbi:MAG TPA: hypothetical protein VD846_03885 [Allosphingosinicella sp.]|nr:hypothetical protein [Allosphingosinicella sp.]